MTLNHYLPDFAPVLLVDAGKDVALASFRVDFEQIDSADVLFTNDVRQAAQTHRIALMLEPAFCKLVRKFIPGSRVSRALFSEDVADQSRDDCPISRVVGIQA